MLDAMDYVGIANIFEKKEFIIDGQKQIYYKKIDAAYGFYYKFNNNGLRFIALTGKSAGKTISCNSNLNDTKISGFKILMIFVKKIIIIIITIMSF